MDQVQSWVWGNQWIMPLLLWLITTIITETFKPRSQAAYDRLPPRLAALLVSLGSVTNVSKMLEYAKRVITGWAAPPLLMLFFVFALSGCRDARAADFGITERSASHDVAVSQCLHDAQEAVGKKLPGVCETFNACQREVAVKYNVPVRGVCVETNSRGARDAGVPMSALPFLRNGEHEDVASR